MADLEEDVACVAQSGVDAASSVFEKGREAVHRAAERIGEGAAGGAEAVRSATENVVDQTRSVAQSVKHHIRARPLLYLVGAFGVGLLVGKLMDHSRSRRW